MKKSLLAFILIKILISSNTQEPSEKSFIKNLALKKLKEKSKNYEYTLIGFIDPKSEKGDEILKIIKVADLYFKEKKKIFSCTINTKKLKKSSLLKNKIISKNQIHLLIKNHHKIYKGKINIEDFEHWLFEIFESKPLKKKKLQNIERYDSHYFLFLKEDFYLENKEKYDLLAKLIHPIIIYYGFEDKHYGALVDVIEDDALENKMENENDLEKNRNENDLKNNNKNEGISENKNEDDLEYNLAPEKKKGLYFFREYNFEIEKIPEIENLNNLANYIEKQEFPNNMEVNDASMRLTFDYKIPTLIYFSKNLKKDPNVEIIKNLSKNYKEYFITIFVDKKLQKDEFSKLKTNYFINMLKIEKFPALRIFDASSSLKKYKFIGNLNYDEIKFFLENFKKGHLKSYKINQKLKKKKIQNLKRVNYKKMKKILKDIEISYLVYVYGSFIEKNYLKNHFKIFEKLQKILKRNKYLKIVIFDHDKNDLDGNFYNHIPFLFLANRNNTVTHYKEDELDEESLLKFLGKNIPYLKIDKFEETDL